jgi:hypothetical protein
MKNISLLKAKTYEKNLPGAQTTLSLLGPISAVGFRDRRWVSTVVVVVVDVVGQMVGIFCCLASACETQPSLSAFPFLGGHLTCQRGSRLSWASSHVTLRICKIFLLRKCQSGSVHFLLKPFHLEPVVHCEVAVVIIVLIISIVV